MREIAGALVSALQSVLKVKEEPFNLSAWEVSAPYMNGNE